jgi:AraC-like DNA-binding protein
MPPDGVTWLVSQIMRATLPNLLEFSSDDVPERDRLAFVREVFGRAIVKHDIEPHPDSRFYWRSVLRLLPGLGVAWTACSAVHTERTSGQIDSDDLVLNITVAGRRIVRQFGREAEVGPGQLAVTRSLYVASCDCDADSRLINVRIPVSALTPMVADLDAAMVRSASAGTEYGSMLLRYIEILRDKEVLENPALQRVVAVHVQDLVALALGATRDAAVMARGRGVRAARLRAVQADILENLARADLSVDAVAKRHGISPRYLRMLFADEQTSFTDFVLSSRLERARRMLSDPRHSSRAISEVAFGCGFGDLSYFNRAFRRRYGATPSEVRGQALSGPRGAA